MNKTKRNKKIFFKFFSKNIIKKNWNIEFCVEFLTYNYFQNSATVLQKLCERIIMASLILCEKAIQANQQLNFYSLLDREIFSCPKNGFLCQSENVCLSVNLVCNEKADCFDGSDEKICDNLQKFTCLSNEESETINLNLVCNFQADCTDQSDETLCGN